MSKRRSTTAAVAALCGGALLLAGCDQGATSNMNKIAAQSGTSAQGGAPAQGDVATSNCSAEDFRGSMRQVETGSFLLELRNTSQKTCQVGGWVHLTAVTSKGQPVDVPTEYLEIPAAPNKDLQVQPGQSAYSGVRVEYGDPQTVAVGFDGTPSGMTGKTMLEVMGAGEPYARLPLTHVQVGTLQPTSEGVLF